MINIKLPNQKKKDTILQTIRFSGELYDKIQKLSLGTGASFNLIVNTILNQVIDDIKIEKEDQKNEI